jgi:hypothetical protein
MNKDKLKIIFQHLLNFVLFAFLFMTVVVLTAMAVFNAAPNTNSLFSVILSFICAIPLAFGLFFNFSFVNKIEKYQRFLLPTLIFPLLIVLLLGWNLYQQLPENMFKMMVADPIPSGVTNIQSRDISGGFDTEIILAFNATPEAIDEIVAKNQLELYNENNVSFYIQDPESQNFPNIHWSRDWTVYYRSFSKNKIETITIWVNPERNTVLFQYING